MTSMWRIFTPHDKASGNTLWIGKKSVSMQTLYLVLEKIDPMFMHTLSPFYLKQGNCYLCWEIRPPRSFVFPWFSDTMTESESRWNIFLQTDFYLDFFQFVIFSRDFKHRTFSLLSWILWTRSRGVHSLGVHQRCPAPTCWVHTGATLPTMKARLQGLPVSNLELGGATSVGWVSM